MATTARQTNLLVNQNWETVYQSFKEADFESYDFETLRKAMIDYLRTYYPEDFNDFTESSEYIALIDLIAFLGQSLAFRTDLNARENFFDTAERRDSILKLANLVSYNAKRNTPASGLLKIDSISTSEAVTDSNGLNLSNLIINWNDVGNPNWLEQMTAILNASLISNQAIGAPGATNSINNIKTDEYSVNLVQGILSTYGFTAQIEGSKTAFEVVSATTLGQNYVYERDPAPNGIFNLLYRNDNQGNGSINTGFFVYFKQGALTNTDFNLQQSLPNRVVSINTDDINNNDVWLYELNSSGAPSTKWVPVPAIAGINIIYNQSSNRNLYQVTTRANDQVDIVFGDGSFSNIPQGVFRAYYRTSNGLNYKITPDEIQGVTIPLVYVSRNNRVETLTIRASLHYTINNADSRELIDDIRAKAPQQYYTQNRMITGEDYNLFPYTNFSSILKVKAVNRSSSGISRFLDVLDVTGKYSSTNIFCDDGMLYRQTANNSIGFSFANANDINAAIYNKLIPILSSVEVKHFYYANYNKYYVTNMTWYPTSSTTDSVTGYFTNDAGSTRQDIGLLTSSEFKYVVPGTLIKFTAPPGYFFNTQNQITVGTATYPGERAYIYAAVMRSNGGNIITLSQKVPEGAIVSSITPVFKNTLTDVILIKTITNLIQSYKNFGLRYDEASQTWRIIQSEDLSLDSFSLLNAGQPNDSSWIAAFSFNGTTYNIVSRNLQYAFESVAQTRFYFDPKVKVYDSRTGLTLSDHIKVLKTNTAPDGTTSLIQDQTWRIYNAAIMSDGYIDNTVVLVTFPDSNDDGIPDDPDLFDTIVKPTENLPKKYVFFETNPQSDRFINATPIDNTTVVTMYSTQADIITNQDLYLSGQVFYATDEKNFYTLTIDTAGIRTLILDTGYLAEVGRQDLYFQYRHASPNDRRIDPSPNNIMDLYLLTKNYANDYLAYIQDTTNTIIQPVLPTNDELKTIYGTGPNSLENFKALSDTIIYNPGKYKPLFGSKAKAEFQATFKVVKNPNIIISDNDIKSSVIAAINKFFDTSNWSFGETFYFSELSAYLHATLVPNIAGIIIVPNNTAMAFGNLMQINADPDEILISAATVNDVQVITAITAAQINQTLAGLYAS